MPEQRVRITKRTAGPVEGFTMVFAYVDGGDTGEYTIHSSLVGTPGEEREILEQSAARMELRAATQAGQD